MRHTLHMTQGAHDTHDMTHMMPRRVQTCSLRHGDAHHGLSNDAHHTYGSELRVEGRGFRIQGSGRDAENT